MRTLKFIVNNKTILKDPSCDFSNLKPKSGEVIRAEFSFSSEWNKAVKVIAFYSRDRKELTPQVLSEDDSCIIPSEALNDFVFYIQILGKRKGKKFETDKLAVCQDGGKR